MRNACDSDSGCGLACDASSSDAKSLAMWVERSEPLSCRQTDRKKALLLGHRPGVPGTPGRPGGFQKIYVCFSYMPFLLPIQEATKDHF